jgi:DNA polymerase-3 subunit beta
MKFETTKDILLKGIQSVQTAINTKSTLPILSNILVEATDGSVILTTTDLDIGIVTSLPIKPNIMGAVTIPAKKFSDIIKELPENEAISISVKKNNLVNIDCEKSSFKIMGLPKEEFPQLPEFKDKDTITLAQKKLKQMLRMTSFAIGHDEVRQTLNGILFVIKPTYIKLVATDGRCLTTVDEKMQLPKTLERKVIVPTKAIDELDRVLGEDGDINICFGDNQILFKTNTVKLISRLIEGEFPPYERVIPEETKDKVVVSRERFLSAIKRVALFTNAESLSVRVDVARDKVVLSKSTPYLGEARVELEAEYKGKDLSIGFNPSHIINMLKSVDYEKVGFEMVDPEKPCAVRIGGDYVYVVSPMRIG